MPRRAGMYFGRFFCVQQAVSGGGQLVFYFGPRGGGNHGCTAKPAKTPVPLHSDSAGGGAAGGGGGVGGAGAVSDCAQGIGGYPALPYRSHNPLLGPGAGVALFAAPPAPYSSGLSGGGRSVGGGDGLSGGISEPYGRTGYSGGFLRRGLRGGAGDSAGAGPGAIPAGGSRESRYWGWSSPA